MSSKAKWLETLKAEGFGTCPLLKKCDLDRLMSNDPELRWPYWLTRGDSEFRTPERGTYRNPLLKVPALDNVVDKREPKKERKPKKVGDVNLSALSAGSNSESTINMVTEELVDFIPKVAPGFVPWGHCKDLEKIISSKIFFPVFITGLTGGGKTFSIQQVAAKVKRECIRVNITIETDEDDLIGGFRLSADENGGTKTVWHDGPVIQAMERGAILLLDEIDLASNKIMCLQPVLEGDAIYIKKIGKKISPNPGFNIIATANTKGKGSESGEYIFTNMLNEAFLDRFAITLEQPYPPMATEVELLQKHAATLNLNPSIVNLFIDSLSKWANIIRKTFQDGGCDEVISTRRLVHILNSYAIFGGNKKKAINTCLDRFDPNTKSVFWDAYSKVDKAADEELKEANDAMNETSKASSTGIDWSKVAPEDQVGY